MTKDMRYYYLGIKEPDKKVTKPKPKRKVTPEKEAPKPKEVHYLDEEPELDEFDVRSVWPL